MGGKLGALSGGEDRNCRGQEILHAVRAMLDPELRAWARCARVERVTAKRVEPRFASSAMVAVRSGVASSRPLCAKVGGDLLLLLVGQA